MRELTLEPPVFEGKRGDFWVTFKNHTLMTAQDKEWLSNLNMELTENEALAVTLLEEMER